MARPFHLTTIRNGNVIRVVFIIDGIGTKEVIAEFLLPSDGQWRKDVTFLDDIQKAYYNRLKDLI